MELPDLQCAPHTTWRVPSDMPEICERLSGLLGSCNIDWVACSGQLSVRPLFLKIKGYYE